MTPPWAVKIEEDMEDVVITTHAGRVRLDGDMLVVVRDRLSELITEAES